jgi:hypothetical protein
MFVFRAIFFCAAICISLSALAQTVEEQLRAFEAVERKIVPQLKSYREQSDALRQAYIDLGFLEIAARKDRLSTEELGYLFEAQFALNFYTKNWAHLSALETSFGELVKRDKVERKHVRRIYEQYISGRRFDAAALLVKNYSAFNLETLPAIVAKGDVKQVSPAIWVIDKTEKRLTRELVQFAPDWQLITIAHPLCHFSENALNYIKRDAALTNLLSQHFLLFGPQSGRLDFNVMQKWNTENPSMPIHPVDQQIAFTEFDQWSTPTFYFMKAGKVVYTFNGWPKEGNRSQLDEGLRKVGAISSEALPKK